MRLDGPASASGQGQFTARTLYAILQPAWLDPQNSAHLLLTRVFLPAINPAQHDGLTTTSVLGKTSRGYKFNL